MDSGTVRRRGARTVFKRAIDLTVGTVLAVLATPVILVLAALGALHFRAWPFFTQTRLGLDGREFRIVKLRSLAPQTDPYALKPSIQDLELSWYSRLIRSTSLDELPQLWLVPLGTMSLVGPRPKMPDCFEPVDPTYQFNRTRVPQGCTCLWQVSTGTAGLPSESPEFDHFYLRHGGLRLDAWIVYRTVLTMLRIGRPVSLNDIPSWVRGPGWVDGLQALDEFLPPARHGEDEAVEIVLDVRSADASY